jgi:hypothetical protein
MATLAEIRAKLQASSQQNTGGSSGGDNAIYPHWNIPDDSSATVRFLPDGDDSNTFFWVERNMIRLPFAGVKGETNSKPVVVQVPCMEMWNETCPILTEVRPWFKDKSLEAQGKKYWKKKSYLFQGFVVNSKLAEDKVPENPIRRFVMSTQIFNIVKNALMDPEIEVTPTDFVRGLDFKISKTSKGGYADYTTSSWGRRERALSEEESAAIKQYGLFNLKEFLPKKPGEVELKVIKEMFEASVDGEAYDPEKWSQYFKPSGMNLSNGRFNDSKSSDSSNNSPVSSDEDDEPAPVVQSAKTAEVSASGNNSSSSRAADIIAKIKARSGQ